jgi:hypothetical protein
MLERKHFNSVGLTVSLFCLLSGITVGKFTNSPLFVVMGGLVGVYYAIRVVDQWQKVALLRFGRYRDLRGPGLFLMIPIVETLSRYADQPVRVTTVSAESTLTRDTVPVNVDAITFGLSGVRRNPFSQWRASFKPSLSARRPHFVSPSVTTSSQR